ncbi:PREDICTED: pathogenesis-related protein STH-2-like [Nelumbo nucifera]|uniref:Pathogenesis-related protein STH-2-like n=1 Tax=Nelumbo nucifera TaxID=4432 RepID=A0A1U7YXZ5_NELNU|nr:PREDICTED: pathogenesis-related protein STH-2-like [Nelumbo nucifera]
MGVIHYSHEISCPIHPARMFKALILDSHNLIPKLMPQSVKSIEIVEGDGEAGSIKKISFTESSHFKYMKHRIDAVDKENYVCKYTLIEGDVLGDKLQSIAYEVKFEGSADGGCVCKMTSEYHTVGDFEIKEEDIKAGKEKAMAMHKVVEAHLLENPHLYA